MALEIGLAFGHVLRQKRKEAGLTQEQLALEADVQRNYVSLMERGINQPTIAVLFKLANALKCSPSTLILSVEEELG
ncbi:helix-turn-helix domain-containing protein [Pseudomonas fragi]|uniref:Helix-turn-helix transcriptional regulator n=1 Tax=Pseudomonas fragi TaxID=296 RepID=A0A9Q5AZP1_PSEFR|nr:helix-turn-helix transcriptional regulator [Pseudomonas fragi]NNB49529.1 helix-turn-helix transcriptional regulator [Pseudomonas fragi]